MNRGERVPDGVNKWTGAPLSRCPWCGWASCHCPILEVPDNWAGDLVLVTMAHRECGRYHCSVSWVARAWEPLTVWRCPFFGPSQDEILKENLARSRG
jgi:hypothetical protein